MFARRAAGAKGKNNGKQDLQSFMREKLQKTKIASESVATAQIIGVNQKNFIKKKKHDNESISERTGGSSTQNSQASTTQQTIYKPNLKKKTTNVTGTTQTQSTQSKTKRSVSRTNTQKEKEQKKPKLLNQTSQQPTTNTNNNQQSQSQKQQKNNSSEQQTIYKPKDNLKGRGSSKPPIPLSKPQQKSKNDNINTTSSQIKDTKQQQNQIKKPEDKKLDNKKSTSQKQKVDTLNQNKNVNNKQDDEESENQDNLSQWNQSHQNDDQDIQSQQLLGQEEIESKYSDGEDRNENEDFENDNENDNDNIVQLNNQVQQKNSQTDNKIDFALRNTRVDNNIESKSQMNKTHPIQNKDSFIENKNQFHEESENNEKLAKSNDEQLFYPQKQESCQQNSNVLIHNNIKDKKEDQQDQIEDQEEEKQEEYGNEQEDDDTDDQFQHYQNLNDSQQKIEIKQKQISKISQQNKDDEEKIQEQKINDNKSNIGDNKLGQKGEVKIYDDDDDQDDDSSDFQTPKVNHIQDKYIVNKNDTVKNQLEMLEKQDQELDNQKIIPKQQSAVQNKRMEKLQQLLQADDTQKKQEQEERLKQIREEMKKEKEQKVNEQKQQQNQKTGAQTQVNEQEQKKTETPQQIDKKKKQEDKKKVISQKSSKKTPQQIPRQPNEVDQYIDYSQHYKTFYDIFVGQILEPKSFDVSFAIRDTRNMYAAFVNIMDATTLGIKKKFEFEKAPLEKSLQDYYQNMPNFFTLTGKSVNELELEMKNRGNEIMIQAMAQAQLKNNFQQLKQKDVNDIVKQAQEKAAAAAFVNPNSLVDENRESSLYYRVVKNRTEVYDIISRAFSRKKRWNELPHGLDLRNSWNLLWTWSKIKIDLSKLIVWQRCNHYSGAKNVSRKDFLKRNIERAQKMSTKAGSVFNVLPLTFILPKEYVGFLESFSEFEDKEGSMNFWIMKPAAKSRGRGISLVNDLTQVTYGEPIVIQRYIKNPLLIKGYKFDMRIYVLVTSVNPLEVFLYKEGFGRFSTMPFSLDPTDKNNKYIHLTNVSIQKYNVNNSDQDPTDLLYGGTKISIQTLKQRVQQETNVNWDEQIWPQVREVVLKSLVACQNDIQFNPCCFELFGFDIMIDSDLKCWLIEINSSPSLARETLLDDMIKQRLIDEIIDLVDPIDFDRKRLFEVLERRINEDFKQSTTSNAYSKRLMNRDLTYILNGQVPRKFGEMPKLLGNFERIAPSPLSDSYLKLIGGQKMFGSLMKIPQDGINQQNQQRQ